MTPPPPDTGDAARDAAAQVVAALRGTVDEVAAESDAARAEVRALAAEPAVKAMAREDAHARRELAAVRKAADDRAEGAAELKAAMRSVSTTARDDLASLLEL